MKKFIVLVCLLTAAVRGWAGGTEALESNFIHPPAEARPWVYWFWNNGNVTSNGITADLEAMQQAGIGGVLIMDVVQQFAPPRGPALYGSAEWQGLLQFSVREAARLGLEINVANGPGWCGSSGPWITPELSMQKLVWTNLCVHGPSQFDARLPKPEAGSVKRDGFDSKVAFENFFEDVALLAFPATTNGIVPFQSVVNLNDKLARDGTLNWAVPAGDWIILRIGHRPTGSSTRPPVAGGNGLECDKLSREALQVHFNHVIGLLVTNAGPLAGRTLTATHVDSWEVGSQNWTPLLRQEFKQRRGYDLPAWLACLAEVAGPAGEKYRVRLDSTAAARRFQWDFNETIAELLAERYSGRMAELAHQHGLRFSLEGYNLPFGDEFTYTARADEPMTEFWTDVPQGQNETWSKAVEMASVAHVYGRPIIGAEAFTSGDGEKWKLTPRDLKALGDFEFAQGVNRLVIHRYAHQPYLDREPGSTMGPWGLHYERTQTWWRMSRPWHEYLARCQYLLRQGKYVADLCYLRPEQPNQTYFKPNPPPPAGYRYDEISAEALIQRGQARDGQLVLPGGMSYRALVLPPASTMTPNLLHKISDLIRAGATVVATATNPATSPSLQDYPHCDAEVTRWGREIWGHCDGQNVTRQALGRGHFVWGEPLETVLAQLKTPPDFTANVKLNWIHRRAGNTEIYFVANPAAMAVEARATFNVRGLRPELWDPETGAISRLPVYETTPANLTVPLRLEPAGSVFVVFRESSRNLDPVVALRHDGQLVPGVMPAPPKLVIQQATYGVPGDANRSRDVRAQVQAMVDKGVTDVTVAKFARSGDPAYGVVKTLSLEYTADGQAAKTAGQDPDTIHLAPPVLAPARPAELVYGKHDRQCLVAREPGHYEWTLASGQTGHIEIPAVPAPFAITGAWQLSFPPRWGAPAGVTLTNLISWSDSGEAGVKYFSGTAAYAITFDFQRTKMELENVKYLLDLGEVQVMARVKLNGQDCGVLWKAPYQVDISRAIKPGENRLEISVANLWPNRMIGDAALPETNRVTWSSWTPFTPNTPLLRSGLLGPVKILSAVRAELELGKK